MSQKVDEENDLEFSVFWFPLESRTRYLLFPCKTEEKLTASYLAGLILTPMIGWTGGTLAGGILTSFLPTIRYQCTQYCTVRDVYRCYHTTVQEKEVCAFYCAFCSTFKLLFSLFSGVFRPFRRLGDHCDHTCGKCSGSGAVPDRSGGSS